MAALLERTQMLSELLGQVNDAMADESDTASRPSTKRGAAARPPSNQPLAARPPSSRPHSTRPQSTEPPSTASNPGRPASSQRLGSAAPINGAQPPPMLRLTAGYEGSKPSPMDRFLQSSGVQTSKQAAASQGAPGCNEQLQLFDEGRRVADYNRGGAPFGNDENGPPGTADAPVKLVRYTGRQTAFGQMQKLRRNPNARASQSSVGGVVFGGGEE